MFFPFYIPGNWGTVSLPGAQGPASMSKMPCHVTMQAWGF